MVWRTWWRQSAVTSYWAQRHRRWLSLDVHWQPSRAPAVRWRRHLASTHTNYRAIWRMKKNISLLCLQPTRYLFSVTCVCYDVMMFVVTECCYETFSVDQQWHWDHAIKMPRGSTLQPGRGRCLLYLAPIPSIHPCVFISKSNNIII